LSTTINFNSPGGTTTATSAVCTYTLTVANSIGNAAGTATATGNLTIVPVPSFGANVLTVTPNVFVDGTATAGLLKFALPLLALGTADSIAMTVTPPGSTVTKTGSVALAQSDLGTTISVDPPMTNVGDAAKTFTYSLKAHNNLTGDSPAITTTATSNKVSADLAGARVASTATVLPNGSVLIVGGGTSISGGVCNYSATSGNAGDSDTGDVYDPSTGIVTRVPLKMNFKRCQHTAVLVNVGGTYKVFIMGGTTDRHVDVFVYNAGTASVFGAWQASGLPQLATARYGHSATLLGAASSPNTGQIVVAGGYNPSNGNGLTSLELFDPTANANNGGSTPYTSNGTSAFNVGRGEHAAALAGKWLYFIGGFDGVANFSPSIDALDTTLPAANGNNGGQINHSNPPTNAIGRVAHSAIALSTTSILVVGGLTSAGTAGLVGSFQKYTADSSTGAIALGGVSAIGTPQNLTNARARFQLLPAGPPNKFLVFGGSTAISTTTAADSATATMEQIDTTSLPTATVFGSMASAREAFGAVSLAPSTNNTTFLISGGSSSGTGGVELVVGP
jgi:hypothetical protein